LTEQGIDILDLEAQTLQGSPTIKNMLDRVRNRINQRHEYDFSHEVYEAMNGCLACKACASQYHSRYQRPAKDYLVANIESLLPIMSKAPRLINGVIRHRP